MLEKWYVYQRKKFSYLNTKTDIDNINEINAIMLHIEQIKKWSQPKIVVDVFFWVSPNTIIKWYYIEIDNAINAIVNMLLETFPVRLTTPTNTNNTTNT